MGKKSKSKYAIKYLVNKLTDEYYTLIPYELIKGDDAEDRFITDNGKSYHYCLNMSDLRCKYVVDMIKTEEELEIEFDALNDKEDIFADLFYEIHKKTFYFIDKSECKEKGCLIKYSLDLPLICEDDKKMIYYMDQGIPNCVLNQNAVDEILNAKSAKEKNALLHKYQQYLSSIKKQYDLKGVSRISIVNNKVEYFDIDGNVKVMDVKAPEVMKKTGKEFSESDISYKGLSNYIKQRIIGHDDAIDTFAQKLYMNYTAVQGEVVDSILFAGPTGTGKTETVRAASSYLNTPMFEINASNLVPQGIKGISIEDVIIGLYEASGCSIQKAERGIVFLDEFDKLNSSDLDIKTAVKNILLTFTSGGTFPVQTDHYNFMYNSLMTNKVYAGVFERISKVQNPIGFNPSTNISQDLGNDEELRKKIMDKKYFTQEELSRISTILAFDELTKEQKKLAVMNSETSILKQKQKRYLRQFGLDLIVNDDFYDALFEQLPKNTTGMRGVYNLLGRILSEIEKFILEGNTNNAKEFVLTRKQAENPKNRGSYIYK